MTRERDAVRQAGPYGARSLAGRCDTMELMWRVIFNGVTLLSALLGVGMVGVWAASVGHECSMSRAYYFATRPPESYQRWRVVAANGSVEFKSSREQIPAADYDTSWYSL